MVQRMAFTQKVNGQFEPINKLFLSQSFVHSLLLAKKHSGRWNYNAGNTGQNLCKTPDLDERAWQEHWATIPEQGEVARSSLLIGSRLSSLFPPLLVWLSRRTPTRIYCSRKAQVGPRRGLLLQPSPLLAHSPWVELHDCMRICNRAWQWHKWEAKSCNQWKLFPGYNFGDVFKHPFKAKLIQTRSQTLWQIWTDSAFQHLTKAILWKPKCHSNKL